MNINHDIIGYKKAIYGHPDKGRVIPIARIDEDRNIVEINLHDYPNTHAVAVPSDFEQIDTQFSENELFVIKANFDPNFEEHQTNPNRAKFRTFANLAKSLLSIDNNLLIPVITSPSLPQKETGIWEDINPIDVPSNRPFFILIEDEQHIYGPFVVQSKTDNVIVIPFSSPILNIKPNYISRIQLNRLNNENFLLYADINNQDKIFIKSLYDIRFYTNKEENLIDYINDQNLISYCVKNGFGRNLSNLSKNEVFKLKNLIDSYTKDKSFQQNQHKERYQRINGLLDSIIDQSPDQENIINTFLNSSNGQDYLERYFDSHPEKLNDAIDKKNKEYQDTLEKDYFSKKAALDKQLQEERELIKKLIKEEKDKLDTLRSESKKAQEAKIDDTIQQKKQELEQIQHDIEALLKDKLSAESLVKAKMRLEILEEDTAKKFKALEQKAETYNTLIEAKKKTLAENNLAEVITQTRVIQNIFDEIHKQDQPSDSIQTITAPTKYKEKINNIDEQKDYIRAIQNTINSYEEKTFSYDETANLLVTVLQNYLTIFSGPPGIGKTSTANNLCQALGLSHDNHLLNIAVGRGWTTTQDLIGYYNSLRACYQPAKTGLYQFLKQHELSNTQLDQFLKVILLDEANLSNIEHYWSDFLVICDNFEKNNKLDLGILAHQNQFLQLPPSLRFLATINNDATVEPLSDRLLDRAAIITLNPEHISYDYSEDLLLNGAIPYEELKRCFMINRKEDGEDVDLGIIHNIISELKDDHIKGGQIYISHRKINTIKNYLQITKNLGFDNHLAPIDYAISQHILPKIKGYGIGLKQRLENTHKILKDNELKHSSKIVSSILDRGNNFADSFDFFN